MKQQIFIIAALLAAAHAQSMAGEPLLVRSVDGVEVRGELESWRLGGDLVLKTSEGKDIRASSRDVDLVRVSTGSGAKLVGAWRIDLRDGTRIHADIIAGDEQNAFVRHRALGDLKLPLEQVSLMRSVDLMNDELSCEAEEDIVLTREGASRKGTITGITAKGIVFAVGAKTESINWESMSAIILAPVGNSEIDGVTAMVFLSDGDRVRLKKLTWEGSSVEGVLGAGPSVKIHASEISEIEASTGRRVWLSELQPKSLESHGYLMKSWPMRRDENVIGGPLCIRGTTFPRGLGLHSQCRSSWELGARYRRFRGAVGIDDLAGKMADANVTVSLDGRVIAEYQHLKISESPREIELDVSGGRELTIEIGFGANGHIQDRVDLVSLALIAS